jgi:transposase
LSQKDLAAKIRKEDGTAISPQYLNDIEHDGVFVLRTNTDLDPLTAMLRYKQLWTVGAAFRTAKHLLATRPIFHKVDATIRGHVFCSFPRPVLTAHHGARRDGSWSENPRRALTS